MNTHGLPNDVLSNLDPFALIIFIPICDLVVGRNPRLWYPLNRLIDHLSSDIPCTRKKGLEIHRAQEDQLGLCYRNCSHDLGSCRPALHLQGKSV